MSRRNRKGSYICDLQAAVVDKDGVALPWWVIEKSEGKSVRIW